MKKIIILWLGALLMAAPICFAQTFEGLYDVDSTLNSGYHLFIKPDGSYFMIGFTQGTQSQLQVADLNVTADGSQETNWHIFNLGNITSFSYPGNNGTAKQLPGGGYLSPIYLQTFPLSGGFLRSLGGLAKFDAQGDTVFVKFYTDTTTYFDDAYTCTVMADGGYLLGISRNFNPDSAGFSGYDSVRLVRTDSNGNMIWARQYKVPNHPSVDINSLDTLSNGKILVGATSNYEVSIGGNSYRYGNPWFMILDSVGNVLKDTVYNQPYIGGGAIYKDINGGYFHFGAFDYLIPNQTWGGFFPYYLAHLDTNFNITWITTFSYSQYFQDRIPVVVRQTHDSGYVIAGDIQSDSSGWYRAWGAKVGKNGTLLWSHTYISDSLGDSYFNDVRERPDGSLVFCGYARNDSLPSWHGFYDAWLVSVDSNGCLQAGCGPDTADLSLGVPASPVLSKGEVMVYPNPTHGNLTVKTNESGVLYIYTMLGQEIAQYPIIAGQTEITLPPDLSSGVYIGTFKPTVAGGTNTIVRIVYSPGE